MQLPITLRPDSEPEPDIAVVRIDSRGYIDHQPTTDEIFLLIEVADNTLNKDRKQKARIYAKAKIVDYWVMDVNARQVYVFRELGEESYARETLLDENATLSLLGFPEIKVQVNQLFL